MKQEDPSASHRANDKKCIPGRGAGEDDMFPSGARINLGEREAALPCSTLTVELPLRGYVGVVPGPGRWREMSTRGRSFDQTPKTYAV